MILKNLRLNNYLTNLESHKIFTKLQDLILKMIVMEFLNVKLF